MIWRCPRSSRRSREIWSTWGQTRSSARSALNSFSVTLGHEKERQGSHSPCPKLSWAAAHIPPAASFSIAHRHSRVGPCAASSGRLRAARRFGHTASEMRSLCGVGTVQGTPVTSRPIPSRRLTRSCTRDWVVRGGFARTNLWSWKRVWQPREAQARWRSSTMS